MPISIYDIAKKAKVAPSTVSRALQDHPRIGDKTKQRILALAKEMEYVPSTIAKSLIANQTWTIGMVLASISDPFLGSVAEGVEQAAIAAGFNVFLSTSQNDQQRELATIEMFQQRRVDGIIVLASHLFDQYARYFDRTKTPIVIINEQEPGENTHFVSVDYRRGARQAVEHVLHHGHRRVGYVGNTSRTRSNAYRFKGYQDALEAAGIAFDPALVFASDSTEDYAQRGAASLDVLLTAGATAVFCFNDTTAIGLLAACWQRGVAVPQRLSIVGFDDIAMAAYAIPPLTTIRQPSFELGQRAMQMMLQLLAGETPESEVLATELVVRQTTARYVAE